MTWDYDLVPIVSADPPATGHPDPQCRVCGDRHADDEPHTLGTLTIGTRPHPEGPA